ncbi:protoporphyrinogen oxidase [Mycobacterium sp. 1274756.6]|uniref:protoporphyrinogen oxidase n=1 Tax=Mycobacterium sp. 1274756.6 TaxID=1834076 RepID=UPI0008008F90|nr:protoporphyrinogen oxidase [Mycobacterium sp. 1274756.6]OBJ74366.1 protoporphyrinogen oxidase [Mycobacterium sp. 1274756.6]
MSGGSFGIVGGGISGLTAAYRLRTVLGDEARIVLFDPAERLGGVLRTAEVAGQPMDVGAEAFVRRRPEVPALLAELGLDDRIRDTTGVRPLVYSQARLHPMPTGTLNGIPASGQVLDGLVDAATLARIDTEPGRALRWRRGADPTVAELVGERFGEQVVARSVDPLLAGVYAGSARTIGLRAAAPGVAAALDDGAPSLLAAVRSALPAPTGAPIFGALAGGYRVLIEELARRARPQWVRAAVARLRRADPGGWELTATAGTARRVDAVIVAVPPHQQAVLLGEVAPRAAALAARIPTASSAVVALALPAGTALPDHSGVLVASGERLHAKAITLSSRKWGRDPAGAELLRVSFGRFGDDGRSVAATDDELVARARADLATVLGVDAAPLDAAVARFAEAMPQYGPGHGDLIAELRADLPATLAVAGSFLDGIGVPACIAAGTAAAARVLGAPAPTVAR